MDGREKKRVILFGGVFDLFHFGHLEALKTAKSFGDYLIVQVASDREVEESKGAGRPVIPGIERAEIVKAIRWVDEIIFDNEQILSYNDILNIANPDVLVLMLGKEHLKGELEEECRRRNIIVVKMARPKPPISSRSTTLIIDKIKNEN